MRVAAERLVAVSRRQQFTPPFRYAPERSEVLVHPAPYSQAQPPRVQFFTIRSDGSWLRYHALNRH
ncbi:hypothetical protein D3C81_2324330 [compost metagenome]